MNAALHAFFLCMQLNNVWKVVGYCQTLLQPFLMVTIISTKVCTNCNKLAGIMLVKRVFCAVILPAMLIKPELSRDCTFWRVLSTNFNFITELVQF